MAARWNKLRDEIRVRDGDRDGTVPGYAQYLRATGRPFALATARKKGGAFEGYSYILEIPNARTFYWGDDLTLGPPADFLKAEKIMKEENVSGKVSITMHDSVDADYIVLNADTIEASTILGFGHKTATYEVTFLHDMPITNVISCDGTAAGMLRLLTKEQVQKLPDNEENRRARKLLR